MVRHDVLEGTTWPIGVGLGTRSPAWVLVAAPDPASAGDLARALQDAGLLPALAFTRAQALRVLEGGSFSVVALDLGLIGDGDGRAFVDEIRARTDAAILVLGNWEDTLDLLRGAWVHGQVPAGTSSGEVAARVAALLGLRELPETPAIAEWGPLRLALATRQAWWRKRPLSLTPTEFRILSVLAVARGAVVTVGELSAMVWGHRAPLDKERVFAHVRRIRRKIEADTSHARFLVTARGEGFRLASVRTVRLPSGATAPP